MNWFLAWAAMVIWPALLLVAVLASGAPLLRTSSALVGASALFVAGAAFLPAKQHFGTVTGKWVFGTRRRGRLHLVKCILVSGRRFDLTDKMFDWVAEGERVVVRASRLRPRSVRRIDRVE